MLVRVCVCGVLLLFEGLRVIVSLCFCFVCVSVFGCVYVFGVPVFFLFLCFCVSAFFACLRV